MPVSESPAFKQIDDLLTDRQAAFDDWQKCLIDATCGGKRALAAPSDKVKSLLDRLRSGDAARYLAGVLALSDAQMRTVRDHWPRLPSMTVGEWGSPTLQAEREIGERLTGVARVHAAEPLFWVLESWLAYDLGTRGADHSRHLIKAHLIKGKWRSATRDSLRGLGAAAWSERGKLGVFLDCSLPRAYWRCRLATQAASAHRAGGASECWYHAQMHGNRNLWAALSEALVANLVVLTDPRWLAQAIERCVSLQREIGEQPLNKTELRKRVLIPLAQRSLDYCAPLMGGPVR